MLTDMLQQCWVHGIIRRSSVDFRERIAHLEGKPNFHLHYADMGDSMSLVKLVGKVQPTEIYNLAAQSHVQVSFDAPEFTADVDGVETTTYTFNPTTHLTTSNTKSVIPHDLTTKVGNTLDATLKFLLPANPQHFTLLVETLDADNNVLTTRTFDKDQANNDILYYFGRTTVIRTNLFSVGTTTTVTLEDWGADNTYDID